MDISPSKRRKLSPTTKVTSDVINADVRPTTPDGPRTTPNKASFMSPTKASLARFHPDLLLSRDNLSGSDALKSVTQASAGKLNSPSRARSLNPVPLRVTTPSSARIQMKDLTDRALSLSSRKSLAGRLTSSPRRRSRTPSRSSLTVRILGGLSPSRAPVSEQAEAQAAIGEQLESELLATASQRLDRVASFVGGIDNAEDGEPQLPPTPTQLGLEPPPEPPKGLLSSSSSKKTLRKRKSGAKSSSPLKPRDQLPYIQNVSLPLHKESLQHVVEIIPNEIPEPEDPELHKRKGVLDRLLIQLRGVESDVAHLEKEVEQIQDPELAGLGSQEQAENLISIIVSNNPSHEPVPLPPKPLPVSTRLALFLPFSRRVIPATTYPPIPDSKPISHHPIELEDPLPYLRVFTPLAITCVDTLVHSSTENSTLLHQQAISLASPYRFLQVDLQLSTDTTTDTVESLSLLNITVWAKHELGTWIHKQASSGDILSIGWGCGRYWETALLRAKFWAQCQKQFDLLGTTASKQGNRAKAFKVARQGRPRKDGIPAEVDTIEDSGAEVDSPEPREDAPETLDPDVLCHLGRESLLFTRLGVSLLITWHIDFDWTGETENHVSTTASFPKAWRKVDERASLTRVGELFDLLMRTKGIYEAAIITMTLMFNE